MNRVTRLEIKGFKTFRDLDVELRPLNVLIGPNGAGKSNLISFFRMLSWMVASPPGRLKAYVARVGNAHKLLHDGPRVTQTIDAALTIATDEGEYQYAFELGYAAEDALFFSAERYRFIAGDVQGDTPWMNQGAAGHRETSLFDRAAEGDGVASAILDLSRQYKIYQFHDTSFQSRMRQKWRIADGRELKEDAGNLAPVLHRMREQKPRSYQRIVETLRLIVPCFLDFELAPDGDSILLQWREKDSDMIFEASQASDGALRTFALVTLLGQPMEDMPGVVLLDEPELGLHPSAISIIGGMLRRASRHAQILVATQSATLLDTFTPEDVLVVEREGRASTVRRPSTEALEVWLDKYSLGQVWLKNLLGGRP